MSGGVARPAAAVPTGNSFDKYGSSNPVVRRLMAAFEAALGELLDEAAPRSLLDAGCGEGVLTAAWAERLGDGPVVGVDLDDPKLRAEWGRRGGRANLEFRPGDAAALDFEDRSFDMAAAVEVLEHVADPERALAELARVTRRWLLLSVPREPVWRATNLLRGAYVRQLGNTPGHVNHWSRRAFVALVARHAEVVAVRAPFPWTVVLARSRG